MAGARKTSLHMGKGDYFIRKMSGKEARRQWGNSLQRLNWLESNFIFHFSELCFLPPNPCPSNFKLTGLYDNPVVQVKRAALFSEAFASLPLHGDQYGVVFSPVCRILGLSEDPPQHVHPAHPMVSLSQHGHALLMSCCMNSKIWKPQFYCVCFHKAFTTYRHIPLRPAPSQDMSAAERSLLLLSSFYRQWVPSVKI